MTAIAVRFPDESVELDNVEERRVLTALEVIYEGGWFHGKTADFPTRDLERVVLGLHLRNWHFFETYKRTICVDIRSRRTIFRYAGALTSKPNNSSWWERLLAVLRIDLERVVVGLHLRNWHFFETYKRTIYVDIRSWRTIFRYAGALTSKPNNSSLWERLLAVLRIDKLKAINP
jgi:hypothetical protein